MLTDICARCHTPIELTFIPATRWATLGDDTYDPTPFACSAGGDHEPSYAVG